MEPKISRFKVDEKKLEESFDGIEDNFDGDEGPKINLEYVQSQQNKLIEEQDDFMAFVYREMQELGDSECVNILLLVKSYYIKKIGKRNFDYHRYFEKLERHCEEGSLEKRLFRACVDGLDELNVPKNLASKETTFNQLWGVIMDSKGFDEIYFNNYHVFYELFLHNLAEFLILNKILDDQTLYEGWIKKEIDTIVSVDLAVFAESLPKLGETRQPVSKAEFYQQHYIDDATKTFKESMDKIHDGTVNSDGLLRHYAKFFGVIIPPLMKLNIKSIMKFMCINKLWQSRFLNFPELSDRNKSYLFYGLLQPYVGFCSPIEWENMSKDHAFIEKNGKVIINPDFGNYMRNEVKKFLTVK